jgi:NTE family protein
MKLYRKILALSAAVMMTAVTAMAGNDGDRPWENRKLSYGIDPQQDSLALMEIRHRMDSIRQRRPTVALVLSGGGAKGAAHVGIIRYLEKIGMPVDLVLGTSMGGLIGGIYALGYTADDMEKILKSIDWQTALSDKVPRNYISYGQAQYKQRYLLSLPFYYKKSDFSEMVKEDSAYFSSQKIQNELEISSRDGNERALVKENVLSSIPSGFVFGQNVNNIISSLTVGYQDETDFFKLPIPFVCVASDMVTSKPKIWTSGLLNTALRSTMSIPALFAPVRTNGMVLVDGGMIDNYPTDLARKMGADYVIGVDLSSGYLDYSNINNLGSVIMTGIDMLGRSSYEENVKLADVTAKPDLEGYNMLSFGPAEIDTIMNRGEACARQIAGKLDSLKALVGSDTLKLQSAKAWPITEKPAQIGKIEIRGVNDAESRFLMRQIKNIHAGDSVYRKDIDDAAATIYGTNAFNYVTYRMEGSEEPFDLVFDCMKGPVNQLGVSGRIDTEEVMSMLVNLGINTRSLSGSSLNLIGKISINPSIEANYRYMISKGPSINFDAMSRWINQDQISIGETDAKIGYFNFRSEAFFSNIRWSSFMFRAGARYEYFLRKSVMTNNSDNGDYTTEGKHNGYFSVFGEAKAGNVDDAYFPTRSYDLDVKYSYYLSGTQVEINPFHTIQLSYRQIIPMGGVFTLIPSINCRGVIGDDIPITFANYIGGDISGRYLDQQIAFMGMNNVWMVNNIALLGRLDARFKVYKNHYLTAIVNGGESYNDWNDIFGSTENSGLFGCGLEYSYDSVIGPIKADLHWSNKNHHVGAYLSIGFKF